jgi:hypothetical protein
MATLLTLAASRALPKSGPFPPPALPGFVGVGSEEARSVALTLASVRRSNGACGFPALRFHEDAYAGMRRKQSARPGCGPGTPLAAATPTRPAVGW